MSKDEQEKKDYKKPEGAKKTIKLGAKTCEVVTDWLVLKKKESVQADLFYTYYRMPGRNRPLTFLFNGGPGASSIYLHVGAVGPYRIVKGSRGEVLSSPAKLVRNNESWLDFTDLVFVDPVGTGLSRDIETKISKDEKGKASESQFYAYEKDLETLGRFIEKFLSTEERWASPVYIAGESYGGFRVGRLAHQLQASFGIGLSGSILISPVLEWNFSDTTDYTVLPWIDRVPTMALGAYFHKKAKVATSEVKVLEFAENFAIRELAPYLIDPSRYSNQEKTALFKKFSSLIGLDEAYVQKRNGRIQMYHFVKDLLQENEKLLGLYDVSLSKSNPFPDREYSYEIDPTWDSSRVYTTALNQFLRKDMKIRTDRVYRALHFKIFEQWKMDKKMHAFERAEGATDSLRKAMSSNPQMKVMVTHGLYDLVTPYFSSERIVNQMRLDKSLASNIHRKYYQGGHMFYEWDRSREMFFRDMKNFFRS